MDLEAAKEMEIENGTALGSVNYDFAFNNMDYSDFVLRISVLSELDGQDEQQQQQQFRSSSCFSNEDTTDNTPPPNIIDCVNGNLKRWASCTRMEGLMEIQNVTALHINSVLLSAHSPFFRKLFTNGMRESKQREATLCVSASEEAAVLDMLKYFYNGRVQANSGDELLNLIEVAEKFGALHCMKYCVRLLLIIPMTIKLAILVMRLPLTVLENDVVRPLTHAAMSLLIEFFKDFKRHYQEALTLPLEGVKAVLASDHLELDSEDEIYDFVISWTRAHYSNVEDRIKIISNSLIRFVRFPMMSIRKLRALQDERDAEHLSALHFVLEAFVYKAELLHRQKQMAEAELETRKFICRAYKRIPVKILEFDKPYRHFLLYLNIQKKNCLSLPLPGQLASEDFDLEYGVFYLICQRVVGLQQEMFRIDVRLQSLSSLSCKLEFKIAARSKAMRLDFYSLHTTTHMYKEGESGAGLSDPYKTYWSSFVVAESSPYFIDDILSLRVEILNA